jgi:hypothetical protein
VQNLNKIVETHRDSLRQFAERIQQETADDGLGWTLFGEIVEGGFEGRRHSIRSVLMLRTVRVDMLSRLGAVGRQYGGVGVAPPLVMTPPLLDSARDAFPLELIEIQQAFLVVFGRDYFSELKFEERDVRLQCERELDVRLIGLRQGLLAAAGIKDRLALIQHDWVRGLLRTLRGMLWLKGQKERLPAERVVAELSRIVELPLNGIRRIFATADSPEWDAIEELHGDVEALGAAVDGW